MEAIAYHVTMRLEDDVVVAPDAACLVIAARTLVEFGEPRGIIAFSIVDTHLHAILCCTCAEAGRFARLAELALHHRLGLRAGFEPARIRPIRDVWHLQRAVLYVWRQREHHGLEMDPTSD